MLRQPVVDTGQSYRAAWWTAHLFAVIAVVSMLGNVGLASIIYQLLPLKEVVPMLLTVNGQKDQVVRVEPWDVSTQGHQLMMETLARRYVELRERIDLHTEPDRWQEVAWMSGDDVWKDFRNLMKKENAESPFEKRKRDRVTRELRILASPAIKYDPSRLSVVQVEWESQDLAAGSEPRGKGAWLSTLTIAFTPKAVKFEDRYMNPVGFQVVGYSVRPKS
jgi:type IV secretion system protein VirB8